MWKCSVCGWEGDILLIERGGEFLQIETCPRCHSFTQLRRGPKCRKEGENLTFAQAVEAMAEGKVVKRIGALGWQYVHGIIFGKTGFIEWAESDGTYAYELNPHLNKDDYQATDWRIVEGSE